MQKKFFSNFKKKKLNLEHLKSSSSNMQVRRNLTHLVIQKAIVVLLLVLVCISKFKITCLDDDDELHQFELVGHHESVHHLMSPNELRRTFQVETHAQVPEYQILKLTTSSTGASSGATTSGQWEAPMDREEVNSNHFEKQVISNSARRQKRSPTSKTQATSEEETQEKPIVIKLSTFGRDFKLRLKRNADFQRRIKDLKMFLVESTGDGQLRYTNTASATPNNGTDASGGAAASEPSFGTTYHDEENFAALLIGRDQKTGELQLDGTIGNDFVIKPVPAPASSSAKQQNNSTQQPEMGSKVEPEMVAKQAGELNEYRARHVHDDDEMFLDEDEAFDLAHQASLNSTNELPTSGQQNTANKWRKYRKLLATQQQQQQQAEKVPKSAALSGQARAKRQASRGKEVGAGPQERVSLHVVYRQRAASPNDLLGHSSALPDLADKMMLREMSTDFEAHPLGGQFYLEPAYNSTTSEHLRVKRHAGGRPSRATGGGGGRHKRQAPDTVWPEVLLVVDYDSFLLHGGDSRDVKRYFVSFWNGVDLRYKLLVHPHIRISLAGMIVAKDRDATPYLERNRLRAPNADAVDAAGALTDMGKYLYREDRLPTYDLAVVITKLDMCRRRYEGGRCNRGTAGFAYVGGACVVNKRLEKVNSVAIIEDSGGFSGIIVAAHEVGHLLGCVHDGSPPPSYLGGPGATHCPWEDGFIMSDLRHTERGFRWSQCSVEQFKHFLNGETATCLYNYPHESQMLHRLLPGTMLSLDEQCKRDRGTNACFKDARVCAQLFCFDSASGYCVSYRPAAEGSPCGEGQVCRNGKCVGEIENIIPDYTHQSQTVVASNAPPARRTSLGAPPLLGSPVVGRLADNGLSASSTSTATSSPDSKPASSAGSQTMAATSSRRMDGTSDYSSPALEHSNNNHHRASEQPLVQRRSSTPTMTQQRRPTVASVGGQTHAALRDNKRPTSGRNHQQQTSRSRLATTNQPASIQQQQQQAFSADFHHHQQQQPYELYREQQQQQVPSSSAYQYNSGQSNHFYSNPFLAPTAMGLQQQQQ